MPKWLKTHIQIWKNPNVVVVLPKDINTFSENQDHILNELIFPIILRNFEVVEKGKV